MQAIVGGVVAFVVVVGWVLYRWLLTGRDPTYLDDPSILLPAPPEGMTAATATIVDGGPAPTAFMAGLFDLASRDEIAFRDETPDGGKVHQVGIELRGGDTDDPRILLNRRRPVGEGEAWLLANLRGFAATPAGATAGDANGAAALMAMSSFSGFLANALAAGPDGGVMGSSGAAAPGDPLSPATTPDLQSALIAAIERSGKPVPEALRSQAAREAPIMRLVQVALRDPAAVEADPQAFARRVEQETGYAPTQQEIDEGLAWLRQHATLTSGAATGSGNATTPTYISAARAATFHAPMGFATFVENYARRQGWIKGLSFISRWKWEGLAAVEVVAGLLLAGAGSNDQGLPYGIGLGIAAGGVVTWLLARLMASRTHEGAVMKAQLAAYRRTLKATFDSSPTLDDAVRSSRMTWLETPDQALVWGVALGLRSEIEAILQRTSRGMSAGTVERTAFLPRWIARATQAIGQSPGVGAAAASPAPGAAQPDERRDYAAVFAGVERIGSRSPDGSRTR